VTQERFIPGESSPRIDREGRAYVFLSEANLAQFEALPDSFSVPHFRMREMTSMESPAGTSGMMNAEEKPAGSGGMTSTQSGSGP
jgi:hypothetical protein